MIEEILRSAQNETPYSFGGSGGCKFRKFGSERMDSVLQKLGLQEGEAIAHPWVNKALETAQKKVEARNFDARKNVLKYDDVMNDQRKVVFEQRRELMAQEDLTETIRDMRHGVVEDMIARNIPEGAYPEAWSISELKEEVGKFLALDLPVDEWAKEEGIADEEMRERILTAADEAYAEREAKNTPDVMRYIEKQVVLQLLDHLWREHLVTLDHLRQVIGWRGYYPAMKIVGVRSGYLRSSLTETAATIIASGAEIVVIGMGAGLQEKLSLGLVESGFKGTTFTCGGFIRQESGEASQYYPNWIDRANLRWAYRMYREPHTIKRYLLAYPKNAVRLAICLMKGNIRLLPQA